MIGGAGGAEGDHGMAQLQAALDQLEAFWTRTLIPSVANVRAAAVLARVGETVADTVAEEYLEMLLYAARLGGRGPEDEA